MLVQVKYFFLFFHSLASYGRSHFLRYSTQPNIYDNSVTHHSPNIRVNSIDFLSVKVDIFCFCPVEAFSSKRGKKEEKKLG